MVRSLKMAWAVVAVVSAVTALGTASPAADNSLKIGIVDVQKVYGNAPRFKQYKETLDALRVDLGKKLEVRSQYLLLPEEQIKELVDLKLNAKPTDPQKARITELSNTERANDDELKKLQGTADLNDQQKARLTELTNMQKKSKDTGEQMERDYNTQLQTTAQELETKASADMQEAINKVATEKSMNFVIAKDAVFFGGTDVTDAVISKLDRAAQ